LNILTFDIEDWYNCDFISGDFEWNKFEVRIYKGVDRILEELNHRKLKGTFFCLGWLAENHPRVIRSIKDEGHHIGCHSYQHELSFRFNHQQFREDTSKSTKLLEDIIGEKVTAFRAPGFSITQQNKWALEALVQMGYEFDCSIFPAYHDYGGMPSYGDGVPRIINLGNGSSIKEFPINIHKIAGKDLIFSGGGFFRLFPYFLIKKWMTESQYTMTYFHPRDFDSGQPIVKGLPLMRYFKSYVGINGAFKKFQEILDDFPFINIEEANKITDWNKFPPLNIEKL
jgi:polysaccharide deacetylase family protein (PEP-CTERM system associated)